MCGDQCDGVRVGCPGGEGVGRQLLVCEVLHERGHIRAGQPVGVPGGAVEEREDGVEIAVRRRAHRAAERVGLDPPLLQVRGLPDPPQHLLGTGALADGRSRHMEQRSDPTQRCGLERGERGQRIRLPPGGGAQRVHEERVAADALLVRRGRREHRAQDGCRGRSSSGRRVSPATAKRVVPRGLPGRRAGRVQPQQPATQAAQA